jgi:class 3 adenylate cyclase
MKRLLIIAGCAFLAGFLASGQPKTMSLVDSLELRLKTGIPDFEEKISILSELCRTYANINPVRGMEVGLEALELARVNDDDKSYGKIYFSLCICYIYTAHLVEAHDAYLNARHYLEKYHNTDDLPVLLALYPFVISSPSSQEMIAYCDSAKLYLSGIRNPEKRISAIGLMGNNYVNAGEYDSATCYLHMAVQEATALSSPFEVVNNYTRLIDLHIRLCQEGLERRDSVLYYFHKCERYLLDLEIYNMLCQIYPTINILNKEPWLNIDEGLAMAYKGLVYTLRTGNIHTLQQNYNDLYYFYKAADKEDSALKYLEASRNILDTLNDPEKLRQLNVLLESEKIRRKDAEIEVTVLKLNHQRRLQYVMTGGIVLLIILIGFVINERRKSDKLLLNILPARIARRLKKSSNRFVTDYFDEASIAFADIAGFTKMAEIMTPEETVYLLDDIFTRFDRITEHLGMEKIKTIGDCYMAAAGIPEKMTENACVAARWALDAKKEMENYYSSSGKDIRFRIGLDCGPVVAGVIGRKKFIYDLWGDAVNTASRMESSGVVNEIQVTERFRDAVFKSGTATFRFEFRGEVDVKGKGKIHTFLLKT